MQFTEKFIQTQKNQRAKDMMSVKKVAKALLLEFSRQVKHLGSFFIHSLAKSDA